MTTTAEDVWRLLAELAAAQKETERLLQEQSHKADQRHQETERRFQETERLFREQNQETDRIIREISQEVRQVGQEVSRLSQEVSRVSQEVSRVSQEVSRVSQEVSHVSQEVSHVNEEIDQVNQEIRQVSQQTDQQIREVNKQIGNLGGKWGRFVENMVAPACETLFVNRGIPVHQVSQRIKKRLDGKTLEIDVMVTNEHHVLIVEIKSSLGVDNVKSLIEDLHQFREFFPEYNQKQLYGAVAGIEIEEGADKYAYRQGLFVLAQAGEAVAILNDLDFQAKVW